MPCVAIQIRGVLVYSSRQTRREDSFLLASVETQDDHACIYGCASRVAAVWILREILCQSDDADDRSNHSSSSVGKTAELLAGVGVSKVSGACRVGLYRYTLLLAY